MVDEDDAVRRVLGAWSLQDVRVSSLGGGLINRTYLIEGARHRLVLQRVSPIFDPRIHENIAAVTTRLAERGEATLTLVPADDGRLFVEGDGVYRMYRYVDGVSFDVVPNLAAARSAGALLGRFHDALVDLDHPFVGLRQGVHDTARHLQTLRDAVEARRSHPLHGEVMALANELLEEAERLDDLPSLALVVGHGDPKLANILFQRMREGVALCLVDLDTVGPIHLGHELGDMWRSWCNRATEDAPCARLDLEVMAESFAGYVEGLGRSPSSDERAAALLGPQWIALELSARFAADVLIEGYFGWDASRFATRGHHNLARARGQWALYEAMRASRRERARIMKA